MRLICCSCEVGSAGASRFCGMSEAAGLGIATRAGLGAELEGGAALGMGADRAEPRAGATELTGGRADVAV